MSKRLQSDLRRINRPTRQRESAPVRDCINPKCGRPTTGGAYCQRCLDNYQRTVREMGLDEPADQVDPNLACAMKMSIIANRMEEEREREAFDAANEQDRYDGGRLS